MPRHIRSTPLLAPGATLCLCIAASSPAIDLPKGFTDEIAASGLDNPVGVSFAPDGRMFVAEQRGVVRVADPAGNLLPAPFIDLQDETGNAWDRGMLGIALDPQFDVNHRVYLLYTVDSVLGRPEEPGDTGTFSRLVRYAGTPESAGNVADWLKQTSPADLNGDHKVNGVDLGVLLANWGG